MRHYIEFEWDGEKAAFVCDRVNRNYLKKMEREGMIRIITDRPVHSMMYARIQRYLTRPLLLKNPYVIMN